MITLVTDGACSGNPGPGGWAYRLKWNEWRLDGCGFSEQTTNNRMELTAVIEGLKKLSGKDKSVLVISDSQYIVNAFKKGWFDSWMLRYEKNPSFSKKNFDLWLQIKPYLNIYDIKWQWVRGHSGHQDNEFCDSLAVKAMKEFLSYSRRWSIKESVAREK